MTQVVAGTVAFLAIVMYAWTALRFANYPAPWSAPWHTKALDRWPAAGNAALRALVLGALAVVFAWPYVQGPSSPIRVRPSPPPVATPRRNGQVCRRGQAPTRLECRGKVQPRPQERSHQAEPPPLCNESLELGNSGQVMPGDCKESRHVATPQRVVQDRVASVFVPAFELTFGLFDSTAR